MNVRRFLFVIGLTLFLAPVAPAQNAGKSENPKARVTRQFADKSPALGALLPDLTIYDQDGKPLRLRSLTGSHSVIVFGCLT